MFTLQLTEAQFKAVTEAMDQFVANTQEALDGTEGEPQWAKERARWATELEAGEQVLEQLNMKRVEMAEQVKISQEIVAEVIAEEKAEKTKCPTCGCHRCICSLNRRDT